MSAEFVDALKGYEYYLEQRGKVSLNNINEYLIKQGRRTIQLRTYNHYRKLLSNGFRNYIPINKFDVFQSLGRIQMAADRRRYERDEVEIQGQISIDYEKWFNATIVNKSLVGYEILIPNILKKSKGSTLWIKQKGYKDIPVILVWKDYDEEINMTKLGVRAFEFINNYQLEESEIVVARLTGVIRIYREKEGDIGWGDLFRILNENNKLIDGISTLIYTIDEILYTQIHLASPVLSSIKFGSPGELQTKVDLGIAEILKTLIEKFQFWKLEKKRYIEENRKKELENINYEIDVIRNAINLRKEAKEAGITDEAIRVLLGALMRVFNAKKLPEGLFDYGSLERAVLTERVLPPIAEIIAGDDPDFNMSVDNAE